MWEAIEGVFCFAALVSGGYTFLGYTGSRELGIPFPEELYPAAAVAAVCLVLLVGSLALEEILHRRERREQRRKARCRGTIRYDGRGWVAVKGDEDEEG